MEKKKRGITEEESVNRTQRNGDFKLLSVGSWACYSCKRHRNCDGYSKLQEGKSRPSAVSRNDGRCACAVLRSSMDDRKDDFTHRLFFTLGGPRRFCSPSPYLSVLWRIRVKVTRLTAEVNQQEILSDPDSEVGKFSDNETQTHSSRVKFVVKISQIYCTFTMDFTSDINMSYLWQEGCLSHKHCEFCSDIAAQL